MYVYIGDPRLDRLSRIDSFLPRLVASACGRPPVIHCQSMCHPQDSVRLLISKGTHTHTHWTTGIFWRWQLKIVSNSQRIRIVSHYPLTIWTVLRSKFGWNRDYAKKLKNSTNPKLWASSSVIRRLWHQGHRRTKTRIELSAKQKNMGTAATKMHCYWKVKTYSSRHYLYLSCRAGRWSTPSAPQLTVINRIGLYWHPVKHDSSRHVR